jgi:hypothetical protein
MFWTDSWRIGAALWQSGFALGETAIASHAVIGHRSRTIDAAMRDPARADVAELSRMMPEKMSAFGEAGSAMLGDWFGFQRDLLAQGSDLAALMTGAVPVRARTERIGRRASRMALRAATAGGRALAPIHATATANQRRLGPERPRQR